ncbi:MAG: Nramp family divalent metal transporter [Crocinitomicaceae bacterium]|nr:Nramp family divalent metal transporter [Crocinitomicaceae bacterium]
MKFNPFKNIGPGALIAAAFIGPGTVTVCTKAGASFGFALLWALLLSVIATAVLQEMSARLGLISRKGLAEALTDQLKSPWIKWTAVILIVSAILIGNSAYQAGNISGGVLGLQTIFPNTEWNFGHFSLNYLNILIGLVALVILYIGNYKLIERALVSLVVLMSISFVVTAIMTHPDWGNVFTGAVVPHQPEGSLLTIIALIGTTIVPYNLFLHASLVQEKWKGVENLKAMRRDTILSIALGGIVSIAIVISAAAIQSDSVTNGGDLAKGLEPLYGNSAKYFLGIGLFSAGITSAIMAPLAAAYVARGCFGWDNNLKSAKFRAVWIGVLLIGVIFASLGKSPIVIIQFAQVANGLLLPIVAFFLLWAVNRSELMKTYVNSTVQNTLGGAIIFVALGLSIKTLYFIFHG